MRKQKAIVLFDKRLRSLMLILFTSIFFTTNVWAEKAEKGFVLTNTLKGRANPAGGALETILYYRIPLFGKDGRLWESAHVDIGLSNYLSPAFNTTSIYLNIEPIAIFDVTVTYGVQAGYDVFNRGISRLPSDTSPTDADSLDTYSRGAADLAYVTKIAPRIKLALGPILLAHVFRYNAYDFTTINNKSNYMIELDTRFTAKDYMLENSSFVLYQFNKKFRAGLNYYNISTPSHNYTSNRLSVLGNYKHNFSEKLQLSTTLLAGYYLSHENYTSFFALLCGVSSKL